MSLWWMAKLINLGLTVVVAASSQHKGATTITTTSTTHVVDQGHVKEFGS